MTFVAACIILYFDTMGSFSTVKSVQYQFVVVSMLNRLLSVGPCVISCQMFVKSEFPLDSALV